MIALIFIPIVQFPMYIKITILSFNIFLPCIIWPVIFNKNQEAFLKSSILIHVNQIIYIERWS